jgi:hypothetical protein
MWNMLNVWKCGCFWRSLVWWTLYWIWHLFLMKKKGDTPMQRVYLILGERRRARTTHISYLRRRETRPQNTCLVSQEHTSPFYLTCNQKNIYRLFSIGFFLRQYATCTLAHIRARMCANQHMRARCKKHRVEHKLSDILESLRLSWI